jgi:spermidine synthase
MLNDMLRALARLVLRRPSPAELCFARGLCLGTSLFVWTAAFSLQWGASALVVTATIVAAAAALSCSAGWTRVSAAALSARSRCLLQLFVAGWTIAAPGLAALTLDMLRWAPLTALDHALVSFTVVLAAAGAVLGAPFAALARLATADSTRPDSVRRLGPSAWLVAGIGIALLVIPLTLAVWLGLQLTAWLAAGGGVLTALLTLWPIGVGRMPERRPADTGVVGGVQGDAIDEGGTTSLVAPACFALFAGAAFAAAARLGLQLVPAGAYAYYGLAGGAVLGVVAGLAWARKRRGTRASSTFGTGPLLATAMWLAVLLACYPPITEFALWLGASVSQVWLVLPLRAGVVAALVLPAGAAFGWLCGRFDDGEMNGLRPTSCAVLAGAGCVLAWWWAPPPATLAAAGAVLGLALLAWRSWESQPVRSSRWALPAIAGMAGLAAPLFSANADPSRPARLLYSTPAFLAYRAGMSPDLLRFADEGRLMTTLAGPDAAWTAWKHRGVQLTLCADGVPRFAATLDTTVCPQNSAELVPAVLPLVLHEHPQDVLLMGLGGTTTLSSCLAFPVRSVTCVEGDAALVRIADDLICRRAAINPLDDERLRLITVEPAHAAAAADRTYDVIIVNEPHSSLARAAAQWTTDFYQRLAGKLADRGLLCQRFQYVDYGAQPLRELLCTLRTVFPRVVLLETAPGEMVFIAWSSDHPLADGALVERASATHVRRLLSQLGWDWSVLLALAALDPQQTAQIAMGDDVRPNRASEGRFAWRLPPEAMRWAAKRDEVVALISGRTTQLLAWMGDTPDAPDIAQRLADVGEQHRILREHPDFHWTYRKSLRQRLKDRPRTAIVQVAHEGLERQMHPEDQRRKSYLVALGAAASQEAPDADSVRNLTRFVEPYDPLVSYFVHLEAAQLWSRSAEPDPREEFSHRLHSVFYGTADDRSVRTVTAALELILEHPQAVDDPLQRWDTCNALLQAVSQRWDLRARQAGKSRFEATDAEESITVIKRTLDTMDSLAAAAGVAQTDWDARRTVLERQLVRPLRTYRARVTQQISRAAALRQAQQATAEAEIVR